MGAEHRANVSRARLYCERDNRAMMAPGVEAHSMAHYQPTRRGLAGLVAGGLLFPGAAFASPDITIGPGWRLGRPGISDYVPPANLRTVFDMYSRMTAPIQVAGQGPYAFVVDTGANQSVISIELAARLGLPAGPSEILNGVAGTQATPTTTARLDVGGRIQPNATLFLLPAAAIGGDGLLGLDSLEGQILTLDFGGQRLRIDAPHHRHYDPDEVSMKAQRRDGQLTLVDADLAGMRILAFLDSGAQNSIGNLALREMALSRYPNSLMAAAPIYSATGQTILAEMADLPSLRVGDLHLPNWPVAFADLHTFKMWNMVDKPALLLGVDILSRFAYVRLDFDRDEVNFRLPQGA
jgi:hypothetical protein